MDQDNILSGLNEKQKEAVVFEGNLLLILAGAGSGKTKVLTHRVAFFIKKKKINPQNILLLTFTNKAANEMKERVIKLTGMASLFSGTFHSFCAKVLRRDGREIGIPQNFIIYDEDDSRETIKRVLLDTNLDQKISNPSQIFSQISELKNQFLKPSSYREFVNNERERDILKVWERYQKMLRKINALDFDDLLILTLNLFEESPRTLSKWQSLLPYVFVDEWQDTNKIQYRLTKRIIEKNKNLTAVGDASQSIYSWRGADFRNINYLIKDFPELKIINLEQNYRSTQIILDAANLIISKNTSHPILKLWTEKKEGEKIKIYRAENEVDEAIFVAGEIKRLKIFRSFKDFAILYRTNAQSRIFEEILIRESIPYILVGGVKFYSRKEIKDVISYLRLILNEADVVSRKRVKKLGLKRYEKFLKFKETVSKSLDKLTTLEILDNLLEKTGYLEIYRRESEENTSRLENIKELRSVATKFPKLEEFLQSVALIEAEQDEKEKMHFFSSNDKVSLMTLHSSKGLEFPVVFIVGMEENIFPHSRSFLDLYSLEEERRLCYVGMTRAKEILYLTHAKRRLFFGQKISNPPSRFLKELSQELIDADNNFFLEEISV